MERNLIAGIAADRNEARITLTGVPDAPGTVAAVIGPIAEAGIPLDMIVHAATPDTGSSDLTFTVPRASLALAMAVIEQRKQEIGYAKLVTDDAVAKVSIVGVGIRSNPQLAATMFDTLAERKINLLAVSTSEIKVSAVGIGMRSNAGIAAQMFETLAERGINILAISTSEIKVSVLLPEDYTELAVRVLHTAFNLDSKEAA